MNRQHAMALFCGGDVALLKERLMEETVARFTLEGSRNALQVTTSRTLERSLSVEAVPMLQIEYGKLRKRLDEQVAYVPLVRPLGCLTTGRKYGIG